MILRYIFSLSAHPQSYNDARVLSSPCMHIEVFFMMNEVLTCIQILLKPTLLMQCVVGLNAWVYAYATGKRQ